VGIALCIGVPAGILGGLFLAAVPPVDRLLGVFLVPLNSMPRIALVPLFILWFGLTVTTKVAVGVSVIFFIALFNARAGVKGIEADILVAGRQLGLSRRQIAQKVILPGSIPTIFAGVRLCVAYAILGVVASEMIAARDGLGVDVVRYSQNLQIDGVWAIVLVLAMSATVVTALFELIERWLLRWQ
jgi:NitT/TauT family transport system permease protein